jgi:hypothetical protein
MKLWRLSFSSLIFHTFCAFGSREVHVLNGDDPHENSQYDHGNYTCSVVNPSLVNQTHHVPHGQEDGQGQEHDEYANYQGQERFDHGRHLLD